ncbi:hypothetical protein [Aestuariispira insulae]|nr:hypothetical protein [Aestuariispira insulae]
MVGDLELFDSAPGGGDDIDLFGDFDLTEESEQEAEMISAEDLQRSIENFHNIFSNREEQMNAASGAILLYQHLMTAGYETTILVEDKGATVTASTKSDCLQTPLLDRVEFLLDDMVYMRRSWNLSGFTVHSISTHLREGRMQVRIEFISL